jgi:DNA-binding MarR family transcriptional regulator
MSAPIAHPEPAGDTVTDGFAEIERLRLVLLRLARRIRTSSVDRLTPSQLAVLATLVHHGQLTVGQIAEYEHVKPPSVSKIVAALDQAGLVERGVDPTDRRCVPIVPTAEGIAHLEEVRAAGRTWLATRIAGLDDDEIADISSALPALERLLGGVE